MVRRNERAKVTAMANLESKNKMSPLQLGIILIEICIGTEMIRMINLLVSETGQTAWLSVFLGGLVFCCATLLMVKLANQFPENTLVDYLPTLWGRQGSSIIIWWFTITFLVVFCITLSCFSRIIVLYLFDRTPTEVVELGMLILCIYAALQDLGTILRIAQLLFFTIMPIFCVIWLIGLFNFKAENLLPLWPENPFAVVTAGFSTWPIYAGFEFILLLLPLTSRGKTKITRAVILAFGYMTVIFVMLTVISIGVLTVEGVKASPYPVLSVIRGVQIPGTFIERLEGYFLLVWIPLAFDSLFILLWGLAQTLMQRNHHSDHRPWVLILAPLIYSASVLLEEVGIAETLCNVATWLGLAFSLGIVPLSLILNWRRKRGGDSCKEDTVSY